MAALKKRRPGCSKKHCGPFDNNKVFPSVGDLRLGLLLPVAPDPDRTSPLTQGVQSVPGCQREREQCSGQRLGAVTTRINRSQPKSATSQVVELRVSKTSPASKVSHISLQRGPRTGRKELHSKAAL